MPLHSSCTTLAFCGRRLRYSYLLIKKAIQPIVYNFQCPLPGYWKIYRRLFPDAGLTYQTNEEILVSILLYFIKFHCFITDSCYNIFCIICFYCYRGFYIAFYVQPRIGLTYIIKSAPAIATEQTAVTAIYTTDL